MADQQDRNDDTGAARIAPTPAGSDTFDTRPSSDAPGCCACDCQCCPRGNCPCCYRDCGLLGVCSPVKIAVVITYLLCFSWLVASSIVLRNTVFSSQLHDVAWYIAGVFVILTVPLSAYEIGGHLLHFRNPALQRFAVRILWMVPIYSVESLCALLWRNSKVALETLRECYEAYVIFCLLQLMILSVAPDEATMRDIMDAKDPHSLHHTKPFAWCIKDWRGMRFISMVRKGTLQYVVVKIACTALELITVGIPDPSRVHDVTLHMHPQHASSGNLSVAPFSTAGSLSSHPLPAACNATEEVPNWYCDGCFSRFDRPYIWVMLATNFSQIWAMYCLILYYHAFMKELAPIRPLGKLLTVKAVVFFSFWQEVAISGAATLGWIGATANPSPDNGCFTEDDVAKGFQDFLITIEMFVAAVAHHYVFSWERMATSGPGRPGEAKGLLAAFLESSLPTDVVATAATEFKPPPLPKLGKVLRGSRRSSNKDSSSTGAAKTAGLEEGGAEATAAVAAAAGGKEGDANADLDDQI